MPYIAPELWKPQGVSDLESNAWDALRETNCSIYVTAGAGAGKTEFLAQKATYLLQTGICPAPKRILAISFKRDAASNLAQRVQKRCPHEQTRRFDSLTFDAFTKNLLDRFRLAIPEKSYIPPPNYRIYFPTKPQLDDFLDAHGFRGINVGELERRIANTQLPLNEKHKVEKAFWKFLYEGKDNVYLTFSMINRLVEWLLRENLYIRRAMQATYPFIFLDEFQDTTSAQYELLLTAFKDSKTLFTAVGDDKQSIMKWAGAMSHEAFQSFETDFNAKEYILISNWRSHRDLVRIQHVIAQRINPASKCPIAHAECSVAGEVAAIWQYNTSSEEAAGIARWIAKEIEKGISPHEIAILVRSYPDSIEKELFPFFTTQGIKLRNVARNVGTIAIQDLLGEDLTAIFLPLFRLGSIERHPEAWNAVRKNLEFLWGIPPDDVMGQKRLQRKLGRFIQELRGKMRYCSSDKDVLSKIFFFVCDFIGLSNLKSSFPAYRRQQDLDRVLDGFIKLLLESCKDANNWHAALDQFEGIGQVPLMTIHKAKGLEFHTMIFYGLDNKTWWSLKPDKDEELRSFFVAFSRAKQRAFFTLSTDKGAPISWIEKLISPAGVRRIVGPQ